MAGEKHNIVVKQTAIDGHAVTPVLQGMHRQHLAARHSEVEVKQILCTLPRGLNLAAFRRAWEQVVDRHTILRTGFRVTDREQKAVHRQVRLHLAQKDWRGLNEREQKGRMAFYLEAERRRGFDLSVPPLMRLALFRLSEAEHVLASTFHRLLLTGHALGILITEVLDLSKTTCLARGLALSTPAQGQRPTDWNDTGANVPRNKSVHQLSETQVDRTPNAVALVYSKGEVSYRELDNQANRVAIHLRSLNFEPDIPDIRRRVHKPAVVDVESAEAIKRRNEPPETGPGLTREQSRLIPLFNNTGAEMARHN